MSDTEFLICKIGIDNGLLTANKEELEELKKAPLIFNAFSKSFIGEQTLLQRAIYDKVLTLAPLDAMSGIVTCTEKDGELYGSVEFLLKGSIFDKADKQVVPTLPPSKIASEYLSERKLVIKINRKRGDVNKFIGILTTVMDPLSTQRAEWVNNLTLKQITDLEELFNSSDKLPLVVCDSFDECFEKITNKKLPPTFDGLMPLHEFYLALMALPDFSMLGNISKDSYSDVSNKLALSNLIRM